MSDVVGLDRSDGLRTLLTTDDADAASGVSDPLVEELRAALAALRDVNKRLQEEKEEIANQAKEFIRSKREEYVNQAKSFVQCLVHKKDDLDAQLNAARSNLAKAQDSLKERDATIKSLREQIAKSDAEIREKEKIERERAKLHTELDGAKATNKYFGRLLSKLELTGEPRMLAGLVYPSLAADALDAPDAKSGPLWSQSQKRKTWKQRQFVLRENLLFCFSATRREAPKTVMLLSSPVIDEVPKSRATRDFCFRVQPSAHKAEVLLCAIDDADKQEWMARLKGGSGGKWWDKPKLSGSNN
eukprot:TRINITY_DN22706_c0_g1_i1.p1 TRINITY_DN22706_c0_g1~~TRINITY_DN22706_c0_g1_i1.p1  ORF type:complete len:301 (+),score=94.68 TRINITY_DN22706_c0_g1_i1:105-1007(+)